MYDFKFDICFKRLCSVYLLSINKGMVVEVWVVIL